MSVRSIIVENVYNFRRVSSLVEPAISLAVVPISSRDGGRDEILRNTLKIVYNEGTPKTRGVEEFVSIFGQVGRRSIMSIHVRYLVRVYVVESG